MWEKRAFEVGEVVPGPGGDAVRIVRLIAEGGFSLVYEGVREPSGIPCAVKVLRLRHSDNKKTVERLLREGKALYTLRHPNVVPVVFIGMRQEDQLIYLVMKLLRGRNLRELQQDLTASRRDAEGGARADARGKFPVSWALEIMMQACAGLDGVHAQACAVHRDMKPENIFVEDDGSVSLFDVGSAKFPKETRLTTMGVTIGTAQYMSPEQLNRPAEIDCRSDLFALGTILYELLSGVLPFAATPGETDDTQALGFRIIFQPHRPLKSVAPHLPDFLVEIVERLLSKKPEERYPSASRVRDLLAAAHARFVQSLGEFGPMPLAEAIAAIPRTAPKAEAAPAPTLPTSTNPFITVSLPPEPPKAGAPARREAARAPDATTERLPGSAIPLPMLATTADAAPPPMEEAAQEDLAAPRPDRTPTPPPLAGAAPAGAELPVYIFVPPPSASGEFASGAGGPLGRDAAAVETPPTAQGAPASQRVELMRRLIAELPDDLRRPFVLNQVHEKSVDEIAEIMGVPALTVRERVLEARALISTRAAEAARQSTEVPVGAAAPVLALDRGDTTGSFSSHVREVAVAEEQGREAPQRSAAASRVVVGLVACAILGLAGYGGSRWRHAEANGPPDAGPDVAATATTTTTTTATSAPPPSDTAPGDTGTAEVAPTTSTAPPPVEPVVRPTAVVPSPSPSHVSTAPREPQRHPAAPPTSAPPVRAPQAVPTARHRIFGTDE